MLNNKETSFNFDYCYLVYNGFTFRMLTSTDLLARLSKISKVCIICNDIRDESILKYSEKNNINIFEYKSKKNVFTSIILELRKYINEDLYKNKALMEKHVHKSENSSGVKRFLTYLSFFLFLLNRNTKILNPFFLLFEKLLLLDKRSYCLIKNIRPRNIISTYPVDLNEAQLLFACKKKNNVKKWIQLLSWDNITAKGRFLQLADEYIVWGDIMKEELISTYKIKKDKIHLCGVPHFDHHYSFKNSNFKIIDFLNSKNIIINNETIIIFYGLSTSRYSPTEIDLVYKLASDIEKNLYGENSLLILRPHPQSMNGIYSNEDWVNTLIFINKMFHKTYVDFPSVFNSNLTCSMDNNETVKLSAFLSISSVVLNTGSTLIIDAFCHHKPVIITAFDYKKNISEWYSAKRLLNFTHLKKIISLGEIPVAESYDHLLKLIDIYIKNDKIGKTTRDLALQYQCGIIDGKATERVVNTLIKKEK